MPDIRRICAQDLKQCAKELKIGDKILLSGYVYTARDAAHKRIVEMLDLSQAEPGPYILCALPLKISGSDGTPVRAVLMKR